MVPEVCI